MLTKNSKLRNRMRYGTISSRGHDGWAHSEECEDERNGY